MINATSKFTIQTFVSSRWFHETSHGFKKSISITINRYSAWRIWPNTFHSTSKQRLEMQMGIQKINRCKKQRVSQEYTPSAGFSWCNPSDLLKFRISRFHGPSLRHPGHPHQFPTTLETCPNHPLGGEGYSNLTLPWEQQQATCPNTCGQRSLYIYNICGKVSTSREEQHETHIYITCMSPSKLYHYH